MKKKRFCALMLSVMMVLSLFPMQFASVLAADEAQEQFPLPLPTRQQSFPLRRPKAGKIQVAVGGTSMDGTAALLKPDGTVVMAGRNFSSPQAVEVENWENIARIVAGEGGLFGITSDGKIQSAYNMAGIPVPFLEQEGFIEIACGRYALAALKSNGTVVMAGFDPEVETKAAQWTGIVDISVGSVDTKNYIVGLKADGTAVMAADGLYGYSNEPVDLVSNLAGWSDVVAIETGASAVYGITSGGTVLVEPLFPESYRPDITTPASVHNDIRALKNVVSISASEYGNVIILMADGSIYASARGSAFPKDKLQDWHDMVAVAVGDDNFIGVRADGCIVTYGDPRSGWASPGYWNAPIRQVIAGENCLFGLKEDGTVTMNGQDMNWFFPAANQLKDVQDMCMIHTNTEYYYFQPYFHLTDGRVVCLEMVEEESGIFSVIREVTDKTWEDVVAEEEAFLCSTLTGWTDPAVPLDSIDRFCLNSSANLYIPVGIRDGALVGLWNESWTENVLVHMTFDEAAFFEAFEETKNWTDLKDILFCDGMFVGLKNDGTVVTAGTQWDGAYYTFDTQAISQWRDVDSLACSWRTLYGVAKDGSVYTTGDDPFYNTHLFDWTIDWTNWNPASGDNELPQVGEVGDVVEDLPDDELNGDATDDLKDLEEEYTDAKKIATHLIVDPSTHGDFYQRQDEISAVGVGFNAEPDKTISLHFSKPDKEAEIDDEKFQKNSAVQVEITMDGYDHDELLKCPIIITVPIPSGLGNRPETFRILHYHQDGSYEVVTPTINGDGTCSFRVSRLSNFVFANTHEMLELVSVLPSDSGVTVTCSRALQDGEQLIVASYRDGALQRCVPISDDNSSIEVQVALDVSEADTVKAFIWDGMDTMRPLCVPKECNRTQNGWEIVP